MAVRVGLEGPSESEDFVMARQAAFDRILASLHDAMFDDFHWPATSALIDEACRARGNGLTFADGNTRGAVHIYLARLHYRGERARDLEREYFDVYYSRDERIPRLWRLPDSRVVHVTELYTDDELKTSAAYNEALPRSQMQNSLIVRLDGPCGSRITWNAGDPVDADGWSSEQIDLVRELLPHLRQYVRVRFAVSDAGALGVSLTGLLDKTGSGIVQLDGRGRIVAANDRARDVLRKGDVLVDEGGLLAARSPADNDALQRLLARALPRFGTRGVSGSLPIRRPNNFPGLTMHVTPVCEKETDSRPWRVAALVLLVDHAPTRVDPAFVQAALGLTPTESLVAALLAEGRSVRDIVALTGRKERTVRWHVQQIFEKRQISRQAELVRQVLSLAGPPMHLC